MLVRESMRRSQPMPSRWSIVTYLRRTPLLWIGAVILLPGLIFSAIGVGLAIQDVRFAAGGAPAQGIVLSKDIKHATGKSGTSYSVRYRFTASNGRTAPATVVAVEPSNLRINRRVQWEISYAYRDMSGKEYEGRSWTMPEGEARKFTAGDHGTIRYDPTQPAKSLWIHEGRLDHPDSESSPPAAKTT